MELHTQRSFLDLLQSAPSPEVWVQICALLDAEDDRQTLEANIERANESLAAWPYVLRRSPPSWSASVATTLNPRLRIVRALSIPYTPGAPPTVQRANLDRALNNLGDLQLDALSFGLHSLGSDGVRTVLRSPVLRSLRSLDLSSTFSGSSRAAQALAESLKTLSLLEHLSLNHVKLSASGLETLLSVRLPTTLRSLSLRRNHLDDTAAKLLAFELSLASLERLDLSINSLTDAGAQHLALSPALSSLRVLHIDGNPITNLGRSLLLDSPALPLLSRLDHDPDELYTPRKVLFQGLSSTPSTPPSSSPSSARLESLRALLYERPSARIWSAVCSLFDDWRASDSLAVGLDYAEHALRTWPDALRVCPQRWFRRWASKQSTPPLSLIRHFTVYDNVLNTGRVDALRKLFRENTITGLTLPGCASTQAFTRFINLFRTHGLERLSISLDCSTQPLRFLAQAPWLTTIRELSLASSQPISPQNIQPLFASPHLNNLHTLTLSGPVFSHPHIHTLLTSPLLARLQTLNLLRFSPDASNHFVPLVSSTRVQSLQRLDLTASSPSTKDIEALAASPHLSNLHTLSCAQRSAHPGSGIGPEGLRALTTSRHLTQLQRLKLAFNTFDAPSIQTLTSATWASSIQYLDLSNTARDFDLSHLSGAPFPLLQTLHIPKNALYDDTLARLLTASSWPSLHTLNLSHNQLTSDAIPHLLDWPSTRSLHTLNLNSNSIDDRGAAHIASSQSLQRLDVLDLEKNPITLQGIAALATSPHLRASLRQIWLQQALGA